MSAVSVWTRRDPFADFDSLVRPRLRPRYRASHGAGPPSRRPPRSHRDGDDAVVRVEVPGLDVEKDVTVEVDRNRLVIRGERRDERAEDIAGRSVRELRYGRFARVFNLPSHVTAEASAPATTRAY